VIEKLRIVAFPGVLDNLRQCFNLACFALIMVLRLLIFTFHNRLTQRDYSYQLDDVIDLTIALCVAAWIYMVVTW